MAGTLARLDLTLSLEERGDELAGARELRDASDGDDD